MRDVAPIDPFRTVRDPLPHFAPFFLDGAVRKQWQIVHARRAQAGDLFAPPDTGFHHNPLESDVSYLYLAASPNFPGEVKIGMSKHRPDTRLQDARWDKAFRKDPNVEIKSFFMIKNARARDVEDATHKLLDGLRSDTMMGEREWFTVDLFEAVSAVELAARSYADPKKVTHLSNLIKSGMHDLDAILILEDLAPGFLDKQQYPLTDEPDWKREMAERASDRFARLHGASFGKMNKWKEVERVDIVLIPITPPPERYFWDYAGWLIPQREAFMGADITEIYPGDRAGVLRSLDTSCPEHQPFLRNRCVVGTISPEGSIDLDFSLNSGPSGLVDRYSEVLYETDLVNSRLMARITTLYWELRGRLDEVLPEATPSPFGREERERTTYLHLLSASLVATRPEDLSPRYAQYLHSAAMTKSGTPWSMGICPVELCEIAQPVLERSGRIVEAPEKPAIPDIS
jgi:hypothetical protein